MGSWLINKKITGNLENYHLVDVVTTSALSSHHSLLPSSVSMNWADTLNNVVVPVSRRSDCF